jgi:hypothetical protein
LYRHAWFSPSGVFIFDLVPNFQASAKDWGVGKYIWLSVTTIIPVGRAVSVEGTDCIIWSVLTLEALVGVLAAGLLVTMLVRRMVKR